MELLHNYYVGTRTEERHEVVVLMDVLADEINVGYEAYYHMVVDRVNDTPIRNMRHFVELVEGSTDIVELCMSDKCRIVLDPKAAATRKADLLARYHVPRDRSDDLR